MPPQPPIPMSRRARWGKQLMSGIAMSMQSLPSWFATYAFGTYVVALIGVNLVRSSYAMEWYFWLFGIVWVAGFFFMSAKFSMDWSVKRVRKPKSFVKKLFWTAFAIRAIYAIFIHFFYIEQTGVPQEFSSADSTGYVDLAEDWVAFWQSGTLYSVLTEYFGRAFSDAGYPLFLMIPLRMFEGEFALLMVRIIHAGLGAYMAVVIYRLVQRSMGEVTGRFAAIFCMLHPVLICYTGMILKETVMTLMLALYIDFADRMLRGKRYTFATVAPMVITGLSLFMFRTVLGMVAFMALFFALVMMDTRIVSYGKKIFLGVLVAGILMMSVSDNIRREIDVITNANVREQQESSMEQRYGEGKKGEGGVGNRFAKYAGAAVFAPLIFTIPFPTMVQVEGQEDMRLIHGGNWMRNVMSGLVILAMFMLLLTGDWRKYTLPLAMMLGYLLMLSFTQFAHSLRFHIPVMPFEMMFAAYAITNMRKKHKNWYLIWCIFMMVACFAWNWFKLAGRGLA